MFKNYLLTILRQIRKNKDFSFINVLGLAVGMAACMIISQLVYHHWSFDRYHSKAEHLHHITIKITRNGSYLGEKNEVSGILVKEASEQSPEVDGYCRFWDLNYLNSYIRAEENGQIREFDQPKIYASDPGTFDLFDIGILHGSTQNFVGPNKLILTRSAADKYFDQLDLAIGKSVTIKTNEGDREYELVAICEDLPEKTHLDFECLMSMESLDHFSDDRENWSVSSFQSYILAKPGFNREKFLNLASNLHNANGADRLAELGYTFDFNLIPLSQVHFFSGGGEDMKPPVDFRIIAGLAIIALIILIIAWINYLNLSLVKTMERLKEIGIRKSLGSTRRQIFILFITEALMLNFIAFVIAMTISQVSAPYLASITGVQLNLLRDYEITLALLGVVFIGTVIIGFYPSFITNTFNITQILLGKKQEKIGNIGIRKTLVAVQFIVTFLLIAGTITVQKQISYMKSAELGFDVNDVMVIKAPPGNVNAEDRKDLATFNTFRTEILKYSGVSMVTNSGEIPGEHVGWRANLRLETQTADETVSTGLISMGLGFHEFFDLQVVAGRGLQKGDSPWTKGDVVINEKLASLLGFETPEEAIGARISGFWGPVLQVRGVIENHHHTSLHNDYSPLAYIVSTWSEYYFVRFDGPGLGGSTASLIANIEKEWSRNYPSKMDYFFLDELYNRQYVEDERFGQIFSSFSALAIFIACLGLFGLTSFTIKQRTKEIGIRKVLGA